MKNHGIAFVDRLLEPVEAFVDFSKAKVNHRKSYRLAHMPSERVPAIPREVSALRRSGLPRA